VIAEGAAEGTRAGSVLERIESDRSARLAMWIAWPLGILTLVWIGRDQWFVRDDWAFILTRQRIYEVRGLDALLLEPQDGHWMTWPILVFRLVHGVFGTGSYLPYLAVLWATHVGAVVLASVWMRRLGVTAWTSTLMTLLLLVFGAGWENLMFAVQIVYNFSLVAFLAHSLLVDHEGAVDRRDWIGAGISLIGVSSSGFGPFFAFGVGLLLVLRRRWKAAAIAVVPQAVVWSWWWLTWGADPAGGDGMASLRFIVHWVEFGLWSTFGSLAGTGLLAWPAFVLCVGLAAWPRLDPAKRAPVVMMVATALVMFTGIGTRREMFGVEAAGWPRYQYMAAVVVAPALALALDQAVRYASWARWLPRALLLIAIVRNVGWMNDGAEYWAGLSTADRETFELVAGSDARLDVPPDRSMSVTSPDVRVSDLEALVEDGAITPRVPATDAEQARVAAALGLSASP
jgi:hypothetical protein